MHTPRNSLRTACIARNLLENTHLQVGILSKIGADSVPLRDRLGLGQATENPFFADIYVPSHYQFDKDPGPLLPVQVFLHGGFLQYGSTSGQHYNQQFFSSEEFGEVRVLLGYRYSLGQNLMLT